MIINKLICSFVALSGALAVAGCSSGDDSGTLKEVGVKATISLGRYYTATGSPIAPSWSAGERAGLMVACKGTSEVSYATPITPGSSKSIFMFSSKASGNEGTAVGFWPSTAAVTCVDGMVGYDIPVSQDGTISPCMIGYATGDLKAYEGISLTLVQAPATLYVNVARGNYSVKSVTVTGNGGVNIAGKASLDPKTGVTMATDGSVTVTLPRAVSCVGESAVIPVLLAPVALNSGYSVKINTVEGETMTLSRDEAVKLESGKRYDTDKLASSTAKSIAICGSNMVYLVDPALVGNGASYRDGLTWEWDATTIKDQLGLAKSRLNHLDDCKPVDNGKKLLVTSSYNWTALIDIETQGLLFYSTQTPGAHSAEILPGNKLVVACSDNGDKLQLYDLGSSDRVLFETPLTSAHGVVWNEGTQRLYAIGGQYLSIYKLEGENTASPKLVLDRSVQTPRSGLHDLYPVDNNTLTVAGNRCYLYDIANNSFKEMTRMSASTALKSVNYNAETGECWYTDSTNPEGSQTWSTQTIRHTDNVYGTTDDKTIRVNDIDVYKVRVFNW